MTLVLRTKRSHLYPGAVLSLPPRSLPVDAGEVLVEFGDGCAVEGFIEAHEGDHALALQAHRTAAGTEVGARSWRVETDAHALELRVAYRLG